MEKSGNGGNNQVMIEPDEIKPEPDALIEVLQQDGCSDLVDAVLERFARDVDAEIVRSLK